MHNTSASTYLPTEEVQAQTIAGDGRCKTIFSNNSVCSILSVSYFLYTSCIQYIMYTF